MYILIALFVLISIILAYIAFNLFRKVERLEDELEKNIMIYESNLINLRDEFINAEIEIKQLDVNGTFESDDEVGVVYKSIKAVIEDLDRILKEYEKN